MTKLIGLTGGIGSGKTTVAKLFESRGVPVYIADEEAKKLMEDNNISQTISKVFGSEVVKNSKIDRNLLAKIVFNDKEKLQKLNNIIHPAVKEHFKKWLLAHQKFPYVIKETAILFETEGNKECDLVITVTAPISLRIERVKLRDNSDIESITNRIKNQFNDEFKIANSDFVIENIEYKSTVNQVDEILKVLKIS